MCILHDLPLRSRIAHGGRDDTKKAKSSAEFSTANYYARKFAKTVGKSNF